MRHFAKLKDLSREYPWYVPIKFWSPFRGKNTGEGGIRTLGTLLRYNALAKRIVYCKFLNAKLLIMSYKFSSQFLDENRLLLTLLLKE